jgi:hypothetical protein
MSDPNLAQQMRGDWNKRAVEDAYYYVAFGRRGQDDREFFDSAAEVIHALESELKRLPPGDRRARRALEIGTSPSVVMIPPAVADRRASASTAPPWSTQWGRLT